MSLAPIEHALKQIDSKQYEAAIETIKPILIHDKSNWYALYLLGQCFRFIGNFDSSIYFHLEAIKANDREPCVFLALGIAYQLAEKFNEAIEAFKAAIRLDPHYPLAYNSLALTLKKCGDLELSLNVYEDGIFALARSIIMSMKNTHDNEQIEEFGNTENGHWRKYAHYAAEWMTKTDGVLYDGRPIQSLIFAHTWLATDDSFKGIYWDDRKNEDGEMFRLFMPNYLNTFMATLKRGGIYAKLVENRGVVLELQGKLKEATEHYDEANNF